MAIERYLLMQFVSYFGDAASTIKVRQERELDK